MLCANPPNITLAAAQHLIATDWIAAFKTIVRPVDDGGETFHRIALAASTLDEHRAASMSSTTTTNSHSQKSTSMFVCLTGD
jgi:hypothetical protein